MLELVFKKESGEVFSQEKETVFNLFKTLDKEVKIEEQIMGIVVYSDKLQYQIVVGTNIIIVSSKDMGVKAYFAFSILMLNSILSR